MSSPARVIQVGVNGHGRRHLEAVAAAEAAGRVRLVAAVDPTPGDFAAAPVYARLDEALGRHRADVVVIVAPIGAHAALSAEALDAGADLLLEKPPTASLAEFRALEAAAAHAGRAVQVGFQALGSSEVAVLRQALRDGTVGEDPRVSGWAEWRRSDGYFARNRWAGRRTVDGERVADGVVSNVLAHTVSTALAVAGVTRHSQVAWVDTELYRAHDISTDDTAWVGIGAGEGVPVQAALTLCGSGAAEEPPCVELAGRRGRLVFRYTLDEVLWDLDDRTGIQRVTRTGLLDNLLDHREHGVPLAAPLADAGAFMCVVEAAQTAPEPTRIGADHLRWSGTGPDRVPEITGITQSLDEAVHAGGGFAASGAPWASAAPVRWVR